MRTLPILMTKNTTSITKYRKPFIFKDNPISLKIINLNNLTMHKRLCNINIYSNSKERTPGKPTFRCIHHNELPHFIANTSSDKLIHTFIRILKIRIQKGEWLNVTLAGLESPWKHFIKINFLSKDHGLLSITDVKCSSDSKIAIKRFYPTSPMVTP